MVLGNPKFDVYRLPDEHRMLREAVRALADDKIAPRAAEIDETGEFPYDVLDALVRAGSMPCTSPRSMAAQEQTQSPQRS
jgi:Acyl-CoA dehydrogenases